MNLENNKAVFVKGNNERFHQNEMFNIQIKRCVHWGDIPVEEAFQLGSEIRTQEDLVAASIRRGDERAVSGRYKEAAAFYRCSAFFLTQDDSRKSEISHKSVQNFQKGYAKEIEKLGFVHEEVQIEVGPLGFITLPIYRSKNIDKKRNVIVFHGGYDSTLEELLPIALAMGCERRQVILFEGPGQGSVLERKIPMCHEWEKTITPLLDYYGLEDVCLVGLSMGGYLAPRAAAFDDRITSVVIWGAMMNFQEVVFSTQPPAVKMLIRILLKFHLAPVLNGLVRVLSPGNPLIKWGIGHGKDVFGVIHPYDFFLKSGDFDLEPVVAQIRQPVFILMGTQDHLVPMSQLYRVMDGLVQSEAVTVRLYTPHERAADHCQIGNPELAVRDILGWLDHTRKQSNPLQ